MKKYLDTADFSVTGEPFNLMVNETGDMLITEPVPSELDKYYRSNTYISHTDSNSNFTDKCYQLVKQISFRKKFKWLNNYAPSDKSVLDYGAGTGDFLRHARRRGWRFEGVEPNPMARGLASEKSLKLYRSLDQLPEQQFKIITLWHVLEHVQDLEKTILGLTKFLKDDGAIFVAVPNFKSFDAAYYGKYWAGYDVPRHLWHFSRTAIDRIFANHGFKVAEVKPMIFDAFYVSLLSEKYRNRDFPFFRAMVSGTRSNLKATSTKEYSSLLYILQRV